MPTTSISPETTLGQLLLASPEHEPVMELLGLNRVRDSSRNLGELCELRGLESRTVARLLAAMCAARQQVSPACVELLPLAQLCDHLENAQRRLHDELNVLDRLTKALAKEKAADYPKLLAIRKSFVVFQRRFKAHLRKESKHLFPVVRRWAASQNKTRRSFALFKAPLAQLEREHSQADEALADLRCLVASCARSSAEPAAAQTVADAVARLERTVHEQIYKENHVLFPRTLPLRRMLQTERRGCARTVSVTVQRSLLRKPFRRTVESSLPAPLNRPEKSVPGSG